MGSWWSSEVKACVFCEVIRSIENTEGCKDPKILKWDENYVVFSDIRPASAHHYLVVPRKHITNPKTLNGKDHAELIKEMYAFGSTFLAETAPDAVNDARYGFHVPPFISVEHLHMHMISPCSQLSFINSHLFKKDTWYFLSPEVLIEKLNK